MTSPAPALPTPSCAAAVAGLTARLSGELSRDEEAALASHLEGCAACRAEEGRLAAAWAALDDGRTFSPSARFADATLDLVTREILARGTGRAGNAASAANAANGASVGHVDNVTPIRRSFAASPALAWAASILLAAGLGWGVGRFGRAGVPAAPEPAPVAAPASRPPVAAAVPASTASTVSNPSVVPVANLEAQPQPLSEQVVYILVKTLREDANPGVRKKAAEALADLPPSPELRDAFAGVLVHERNPAIRIVAVEALARSAKETRDPLSVEALRARAADQRETGYVRSRAAGALAGLAL